VFYQAHQGTSRRNQTPLNKKTSATTFKASKIAKTKLTKHNKQQASSKHTTQHQHQLKQQQRELTNIN
jgi:hypothetical protein